MSKSLRDRTKAELLDYIKDLRGELRGKNEEIKKLSAHHVEYDLTKNAVSLIKEGDEFKVVVVKFDPESGAAKVEGTKDVKPHGKSAALAQRAATEFLIEEIVRKV